MNPFANWTAQRVFEHNDRVAGGKFSDRPGGVESANRERRADPLFRECKLHEQIIAFCKVQGWLCFHGSTAHRTRRTVGEPDCIVVCPNRVHFIECKRPGQKPTPAQAATIAWLKKLGASAAIVHDMREFAEATKGRSADQNA